MKVILKKEYEINTQKPIEEIQEQVTNKLKELEKTFLIESYGVHQRGVLTIIGYQKN